MTTPTLDYTYDPTTLRVTSRGKFQGEPRWAPHFYDLWSDSAEDMARVPGHSEFYVTAEDAALFPELHGFYLVKLYEDDDGFVWTQAIPEPREHK